MCVRNIRWTELFVAAVVVIVACHIRSKRRRRNLAILVVKPIVPSRLIILDLDGTLLRQNIEDQPDVLRHPRSSLSEGRLQELFVDVDFFRHFIRCCADQGHFVRIASWANTDAPVCGGDVVGMNSTIALLMREVLGDGDLCNSEHIAAWKDTTKVKHFTKLIDHISAMTHSAFNPESVVVIDDNRALVNEALNLRYTGYHCDGFSREWFQRQPALWRMLGFVNAVGSIPTEPNKLSVCGSTNRRMH